MISALEKQFGGSGKAVKGLLVNNRRETAVMKEGLA